MMMGILDVCRYLYPILQCKYNKKKKKELAELRASERVIQRSFVIYLRVCSQAI